jgi:hypothetical protein
MSSSEITWEQWSPQLRVGVRLCLLGLLVAYCLLFPLKSVGMLPSHVTWLGCALVPAVLFSFFGSLFASLLWLRERWWMAFLPFALLCCAAMFLLLLAERSR